jgi:glycosyltransferase involved in cell wall biosynthesis
MKVALVAPPFITVPPKDYGGTELFIGHLAEGLKKKGIEVAVYTNGESTIDVERRWIYEHAQWPIKSEQEACLRELDHTSWSLQDAAARDCDVIHLNSALAVTLSRFTQIATVCTLHGPHDAKLSELYARFLQVHYVCISQFQCDEESMPHRRTIHHGIDLAQYHFVEQKQRYLSFIGRIAPIKGTHLAIDVAKRTGIPLKIAGEIQPAYHNYFEKKVKPELDGKLIEYVGLADLKMKNELLANSMAMLFPIRWNEPFGLVMVEAMACGTPVLALPGGSVPEIVKDGVSGYICRAVPEMAKRLQTLDLSPGKVRHYVEENFSNEHMVDGYIALYQDCLAERRQPKIA